MTTQFQTEIDTILDDLRESGSDIRAGKAVNLTPLEVKVRDLHTSISGAVSQSSQEERGYLDNNLKLILDGLADLEELVVAQKDSLPPTDTPVTLDGPR